MPLPTAGDVHVNRPLTSVSIAFLQSLDNFVATKVFPVIPVDNQSDVYFAYPLAYWRRSQMKKRAPATESHGAGFKVDPTGSYYAAIQALHHDIDDARRANSDAVLNTDTSVTKFLTQMAAIGREKDWAAAFFAGGIWARDYDGVSVSPSTNEVLQWNDASSTPIEDVWDAKEEILQNTGFEPNRLVLGYPVYKALCNHPDIVDRVKAGQTPGGAAVVEESDLAKVFKVERVLVMRASEDTSLEEGTSSSAFIGGKKALLCYATPTPGLEVPTAGYCFTWRGYLGAGPEGNRIKRFRMEQLAADRVEIEMAWDMKVISNVMGAFWDAIVA